MLSEFDFIALEAAQLKNKADEIRDNINTISNFCKDVFVFSKKEKVDNASGEDYKVTAHLNSTIVLRIQGKLKKLLTKFDDTDDVDELADAVEDCKESIVGEGYEGSGYESSEHGKKILSGEPEEMKISSYEKLKQSTYSMCKYLDTARVEFFEDKGLKAHRD